MSPQSMQGRRRPDTRRQRTCGRQVSVTKNSVSSTCRWATRRATTIRRCVRVRRRSTAPLVALDVNTGKPRWVFQTVHNDVWDYDLGSQPTLIEFPTASGKVPAFCCRPRTAISSCSTAPLESHCTRSTKSPSRKAERSPTSAPRRNPSHVTIRYANPIWSSATCGVSRPSIR